MCLPWYSSKSQTKCEICFICFPFFNVAYYNCHGDLAIIVYEVLLVNIL